MDIIQLHTSADKTVVAFGESRIGGRSENQDSIGACHTPLGFIVTVCDGMGGGPGGKTASTIAVQEIITAIQETAKDETIANTVIKAIRRANMAIIEAGNSDPALKGMGSTATVFLINEHSAIIAHVGDSRVYQLRGSHKVFRTFDHSMVFELVSQGVITEEQARLSAQSNIITRALGVRPDVEVDVTEVAYLKGDRFMLTTDGIHGAMPEKELLLLASDQKTALGAIVDDIATRVDNMGRLAGRQHDNLTIAIVQTLTNSTLKPTMTLKTKLIIVLLSIIAAVSIALNVFLFTSHNQGTSEPSPIKDSTILNNQPTNTSQQ